MEIERRKFVVEGGLGLLALAISGCEFNSNVEAEITDEQAEQLAVLRSVCDIERMMFYMVTGQQLSIEEWRRVFEIGRDRIKSGVDPFDPNLWKEPDGSNALHKTIDGDRQKST